MNNKTHGTIQITEKGRIQSQQFVGTLQQVCEKLDWFEAKNRFAVFRSTSGRTYTAERIKELAEMKAMQDA